MSFYETRQSCTCVIKEGIVCCLSRKSGCEGRKEGGEEGRKEVRKSYSTGSIKGIAAPHRSPPK